MPDTDPVSLERRLVALSRKLADFSRRGWVASSLVSPSGLPGVFRSRRASSVGVEADVPAIFQMGDDPAGLDPGRLDPRNAEGFVAAIFNGDLRSRRSIFRAEAELVLVLDLSRSMLSGLDDDLLDPALGPSGSKLHGLFLAAAAFLAVAESARFRLRVLFLSGGEVLPVVLRPPRETLARVLPAMARLLDRTLAASIRNPDRVEPFTMRAGLALAALVPNRSVVVVVSDFLDPMVPEAGVPAGGDYGGVLARVLARHAFIAVDLAAGEDFACPAPGWPERLNSTRFRSGELARHVEFGRSTQPISRRQVTIWNERRQADRASLRWMVLRSGGRIERAWGLDFARCLALAASLIERLA